MNRLGFIGGSDATRIMTGNWYDLWAEKTSRKEPDDLSDNLAVQIGIATESLNIKKFYSEYGIETQGPVGTVIEQATYEIDCNGVPYKGTVDARIPDAIVECKHTYESNTMSNQLIRYMPQLQFYMQVSKVKRCYFANIFGNRRWECKSVSFDGAYVNHMNIAIKAFWTCVEDDTAPTDGAPPSANIDKIPVDDMVRRDASSDNQFISIAHDFMATMNDAKSHDAYKKMLKELVAANEREVYSDVLTISRDKRGSLRITPSKKEN